MQLYLPPLAAHDKLYFKLPQPLCYPPGQNG
jgi:hypothetical protein